MATKVQPFGQSGTDGPGPANKVKLDPLPGSVEPVDVEAGTQEQKRQEPEQAYAATPSPPPRQPHQQKQQQQQQHVTHQPAVRKGTGKRRRRLCRLCCLAVTLVISFGIYLLAVFAASIVATVPFDPRNQLALQIRGCDVNVVTGSASTVEIQRWLGKESSHKVTWNTQGTAVVNVVADNPSGCDALQFACNRICSVTITTTLEEPPTYIYVAQRSDDDKTDHVKVTVAPGVHLQSFRVDGPSAEVHMSGATIDGSLTVRGQGAPVFITDTTYGSADLRALNSAVYLADTKPANRDIALSYRSTSNNMCISARSNSVAIDPEPAWQENAAPWSSCSIDHTWWGRKTTTHYDINNDFMISISEFGEGLTKLSKCCGSACPFRSLCGGLEAQMFPTSASSGENTLSGRSGIVTDSEFLRRLKELNDTTLVPFCLAEALIDEGSATVSVPTKIMADGEIRIDTTTEAWSNPAKPDNSKEGSTLNTTFYTAPGRIPGLKLLKRDADRLTTELRDKYGDKDHVDDVFAIIDVAASPGVPPGRWLYTTRPIFLNLPPAQLRLLSAGLLVPPIKQYRVHFVGAECNENGTRYDGDSLFDEQARQVGIFQQLSIALTPRFQLEMRGVLVRVMPDHRPAPENPHFAMFERDYASGSFVPVEFATANDVWALTAVILSIAIGAAMSASITILTIVYLRTKLRERHKRLAIKRKLMRLAIYGATSNAKEQDESEDDADSDAKLFNPFETPLLLVEILIVAPLRRPLSNSLSVFIRRHCKLAKDPDNSVTMREFLQAYSQFCYQNDLAEVRDRQDIQRRLVTARFDTDKDGEGDVSSTVIPLTCQIERLHGIRLAEGYTAASLQAELQALIDANVQRAQAEAAAAADAVDTASAVGAGAGAGATVAVEAPAKPRPMRLSLTLQASSGTTQDVSEEQLLNEFLGTYCTIKGVDSSQFLEVQDVDGQPGFLTLFSMYCEANGWTGPQEVNADMFELHNLQYFNRRVMTLRNLALRDVDGGERVKLGCRWYTFEGCTVWLHMVVLMIVPILIMKAGFSMQYMYAETTASVSAVSFFDVMGSFPPDLHNRDMMIIVEVIAVAMLGYMGIALLRLFTYYLDLECALFNVLVRKLFAVVLTIFLFCAITYGATVGMWFVLAAVLNPTHYLPYGMAVITLVVVGTATWGAMFKAAKVLRARVVKTFHKHLQSTMKRARKAMLEQARIERQRESAAMLRRRNVSSTAESEDKEKEKEFEVTDIFVLLNRNGDSTLTKEEFDSIFTTLQIKVSPRKRAQMFAFCDMDGNNSISEKEFIDAWKWMEQQIIAEVAEEAGLSDAAIAIAVVWAIVMLVAVFAFIFIAIRAWDNAGSFDAVIQSLLVVGSGKVMTLSKKKPKSPEELDNMVDELTAGAEADTELVTS